MGWGCRPIEISEALALPQDRVDSCIESFLKRGLVKGPSPSRRPLYHATDKGRIELTKDRLVEKVQSFLDSLSDLETAEFAARRISSRIDSLRAELGIPDSDALNRVAAANLSIRTHSCLCANACEGHR